MEIAIRALSAAVNDTFTALTCIDWLGESLCKIAAEWSPTQIHRDESGQIRLISAAVGYQRIVERAYEKIRQASRERHRNLLRARIHRRQYPVCAHHRAEQCGAGSARGRGAIPEELTRALSGSRGERSPSTRRHRRAARRTAPSRARSSRARRT